MTTATAIKIDPEIRDLIPPLSSAERAGLKTLLAERGCEEPLTVWEEEGILLDGHHRHALCEEMRIPFKVREVSFQDRDSALAWICAYQLGRRNLPAQARGEIVLKREEAEKRSAKARMLKGLPDPSPNSDEGSKGRSDDALAKEAGMGRDTLRKVKAVRDHAPDDVRQKARRGEISVNAAFKATPAPKPAAKPKGRPKPEPEPVTDDMKEIQRGMKRAIKAISAMRKSLGVAGLIDSKGNVDAEYVARFVKQGRPELGSRHSTWSNRDLKPVAEALAAFWGTARVAYLGQKP